MCWPIRPSGGLPLPKSALDKLIEKRQKCEIKRDTHVVGKAPDDEAISMPLVGAILLEQNDERAVQTRPLQDDLETMAAFGAKIILLVKLPAAPAADKKRARSAGRTGATGAPYTISVGHDPGTRPVTR